MKKLLYIGILCGLCGPAAYGQSVTIVDKDGLTHKFPTESIKEITFEKAEAPQPGITFSDITLKDWGKGNVNIVLSGEGVSADMDVYGPVDATYLNAGTYVCDDSASPFTVSTSNYTVITVDGANHSLKSGSMIVEDNEGLYTITTHFVLDDGKEVNGTYTGKLPDYSSHPGALEMKDAIACAQVDINDPVDGEFYLRLNDEYWNYEMVLDIFCAEGSTVLTDGVYTYSATPKAGNFGPRTVINSYSPHFDSHITGGTITVTTDGENTLIELDGIMETGREVKCVFNGKVSYLK